MTEAGSQPGAPLPSPARPLDHTPVHTTDLPATPIRDRAIPATAWVEAPADLLALGADLPDAPVARYIRRIGPWLLWRAGPPNKGDARLWAARSDDLTTAHTFRLFPHGRGEGIGPSGTSHERFRTWKEDLRDADETHWSSGAWHQTTRSGVRPWRRRRRRRGRGCRAGTRRGSWWRS